MIINLTDKNSYLANTYLYVSDGEAMLVDAAVSSDTVKEALKDAKATLKAIVLTHGHYDHVICINKLKEAFRGVPTYSGPREGLILTSETANVSTLFGYPIRCEPADTELSEGSLIKIGSSRFTVLETPGHTIGSVCLLNSEEKIMFSGDTLFAGGIGRTDFEYGSYAEIQKSLSKLANLPEDIKFYPGHGESSVLGWEF